MSACESKDLMNDADSQRKTQNGADAKPMQIASRNPYAGCNSFYRKPDLTGRHSSAPSKKNPFANPESRSLSADDILPNETKFNPLGSLEKQYTRGVVSTSGSEYQVPVVISSAPIRGKRLHEMKDRRCISEGILGRPGPPSPGSSFLSQTAIDTPVLSGKRIINRDSRGAEPHEWTKQRMHENNMEWRGGYENWRGRAFQVYDHMAKELLRHVIGRASLCFLKINWPKYLEFYGYEGDK